MISNDLTIKRLQAQTRGILSSTTGVIARLEAENTRLRVQIALAQKPLSWWGRLFPVTSGPPNHWKPTVSQGHKDSPARTTDSFKTSI